MVLKQLGKDLVDRLDTLEEELASAREAASGAEAKAAALSELKDKLAASLKAKMQEQTVRIEKLEQLEKEKKALEDHVKAMREEESAAMKELSAQFAAAKEERGRAGVELEQMKQLLRKSDGGIARLEEEQVARIEKDRTQIEEEGVRLKARLADVVKACNMPRRILRARPHGKTDSESFLDASRAASEGPASTKRVTTAQISKNLQPVPLQVPEEGLLFSVDSFERDSVRSVPNHNHHSGGVVEDAENDAKSVRVQISLIESHCVSSPAASVKGSSTEVSYTIGSKKICLLLHVT
jgi:myosin heavy subunit